jgi:rod shape-determining protein MreB
MTLHFVRRHFARDLGIDLGTANSLVYERGRGVVLREPSVVAVKNGPTKEILAIGEEARQMIGRTPGDIEAIRPLNAGVIGDFNITREMIRYLIRKATKGRPFFKPRVVVSVTSQITDVERRAVTEATLWAGAREAFLIEEPVAAAIGAGLPVHEPSGNMVVDIGGGTTDIAVISLGSIVTGQLIRVGGEAFDEALARFIRRKFNLMIGERTAEDLKIAAAWAIEPTEKNNTAVEVRGRDHISGLPKVITVQALEIFEAVQEPLETIIAGIRTLLEHTPPELLADIMDKEIVATGGGSLMRGFAERLAKEIRMPVRIADNPFESVVLGIGQTLENLSKYQRLFIAAKKAAT